MKCFYHIRKNMIFLARRIKKTKRKILDRFARRKQLVEEIARLREENGRQKHMLSVQQGRIGELCKREKLHDAAMKQMTKTAEAYIAVTLRRYFQKSEEDNIVITYEQMQREENTLCIVPIKNGEKKTEYRLSLREKGK